VKEDMMDEIVVVVRVLRSEEEFKKKGDNSSLKTLDLVFILSIARISATTTTTIATATTTHYQKFTDHTQT
jgi:hypothetical protein